MIVTPIQQNRYIGNMVANEITGGEEANTSFQNTGSTALAEYTSNRKDPPSKDGEQNGPYSPQLDVIANTEQRLLKKDDEHARSQDKNVSSVKDVKVAESATGSCYSSEGKLDTARGFENER